MTARILIVDDVPANTRLLQAKLTAEYYHVETAADGFEALRLAQSWQPDVILLDVMMPGMDGYQACRRLKSDEQTLHIPVVMITALGDATERLHGLEVGADDFLTKPLDYDTLLARLRGLIRLKRLLDEWRVRSETANKLGLSNGHRPEFSVAGARALVVDDWDMGALTAQDALAREGIIPTRALLGERGVGDVGQRQFRPHRPQPVDGGGRPAPPRLPPAGGAGDAGSPPAGDRRAGPARTAAARVRAWRQ